MEHNFGQKSIVDRRSVKWWSVLGRSVGEMVGLVGRSVKWLVSSVGRSV